MQIAITLHPIRAWMSPLKHEHNYSSSLVLLSNQGKISNKVTNIVYQFELFSGHGQPFGHGTRRIIYWIHDSGKRKTSNHVTKSTPVRPSLRGREWEKLRALAVLDVGTYLAWTRTVETGHTFFLFFTLSNYRIYFPSFPFGSYGCAWPDFFTQYKGKIEIYSANSDMSCLASQSSPSCKPSPECASQANMFQLLPQQSLWRASFSVSESTVSALGRS